MYGLFYPENSERYMPYKEFQSVDDACGYMSVKHWFMDITAHGDKDVRAWLNGRTGDILVLRELQIVRRKDVI